MTAYVIAQIEVHDAELYEDYKAMAASAVAAHGGRYIVRGGQVTALEGEWAPSRFVVLEFESVESAQAWWDSEEYREAKALRQATASSEVIVVEGA